MEASASGFCRRPTMPLEQCTLLPPAARRRRDGVSVRFATVNHHGQLPARVPDAAARRNTGCVARQAASSRSDNQRPISPSARVNAASVRSAFARPPRHPAHCRQTCRRLMRMHANRHTHLVPEVGRRHVALRLLLRVARFENHQDAFRSRLLRAVDDLGKVGVEDPRRQGGNANRSSELESSRVDCGNADSRSPGVQVRQQAYR